MRKAIAVAVLLFAAVATRGQGGTAINLGTVKCSVAYALNYAGNIFCSDMQATVNGTPYYVSVGVHLETDAKTIYTPLSSVSLWNLATDEVTSYPLSGSLDNVVSSNGGLQSATIAATFSAGSISLPLQQYFPKPPCGRSCHIANYLEQNSTLVLN
jgi:hypothetical protein